MWASLRMLSLFAVLATVAGCSGKSESTAPTDEDAEAQPVGEKDKSWGGWRWKGRRDDCFFLHENRCFASFAKACEVAGCDEEQCEHDDSAPAVVSCKGAE